MISNDNTELEPPDSPGGGHPYKRLRCESEPTLSGNLRGLMAAPLCNDEYLLHRYLVINTDISQRICFLATSTQKSLQSLHHFGPI